MKFSSIVTSTVLTLIPVSSRAAVIDKIECDFKIKDFSEDKTYRYRSSFDSYRTVVKGVPLPQGQTVFQGKSVARFNIPFGDKTADVAAKLNYYVAEQVDSEGSVTSASSMPCNNLSVSLCLPGGVCSNMDIACAIPANPVLNWKQAEVVNNHAYLDASDLKFSRAPILESGQELGEVVGECRLLGSINTGVN